LCRFDAVSAYFSCNFVALRLGSASEHDVGENIAGLRALVRNYGTNATCSND
jgi:hypothetical protein